MRILYINLYHVLLLFDCKNGNILLDQRKIFDMYGTPEIIVVGRLGECVLLDITTGNLIWQFKDTKDLWPPDLGWYL